MAQISSSASVTTRLRRELSTFGAVLLGLGAIVGAGAFVGLGIATGIAGPAVVLALVLAAIVATLNGLSSAQLAASHPLGGGTYEYGYKYLNAPLGFIAGWMFLCAMSAAAATAALGFAGYLLSALGVDSGMWRIGFGLLAVTVVTSVVLAGIRQSFFMNLLVVGLTFGALLFFIVGGLPGLAANGAAAFDPFFPLPSAGVSPMRALFHAAALMFVAYAGYGRIAKLGEEVREPQRTIPRAILVALVISMLLYMGVAVAAIGNVGAETFALATASTAAPLEMIAIEYGILGAGYIVAVGAMAAMLGVLLYLVLDLSRLVLAMGRRRDMPVALSRIDKMGNAPDATVLVVGVIVAVLVLIGNVRTTWSLSAFTVLVYYAITNLAAYQLPAEKRLYPRFWAALGLLACLFLAFWVEPAFWFSGLMLIAVGLVWRWAVHKL